MSDDAFEVIGGGKSFGSVKALDGVDLSAPPGTVLGLLGPNGAGRTTTVRILPTTLRPIGGAGARRRRDQGPRAGAGQDRPRREYDAVAVADDACRVVTRNIGPPPTSARSRHLLNRLGIDERPN